MKLLPQSPPGGHIHVPYNDERKVTKCVHCGRLVTLGANELYAEPLRAWRPVQFEPSDFKRRDTGDYIIPSPDIEDSWLACVWNMSGKGYTPEWRHDRMMMSAPSFKTLRDAIADRCQGT